MCEPGFCCIPCTDPEDWGDGKAKKKPKKK